MHNDPDQPHPPPYEQPYWRQPPPEYVQPPPPYGQTQWAEQPPPPPYAPTQYGVPPYGAPPPGYAPPPARQSNRWVWIPLGILGGLIVLGLVACVFSLVLAGKAAQQTISTVAKSIEKTETASASGNAQVTVQQYYTAIESQDYAAAYGYLESNLTTTDGQTLTQQLFTQAAMQRDTSLGQITSFTITPDTNDSTKFTVSVTRGTSAPYTVNIQATLVGSDWKISSYDAI